MKNVNVWAVHLLTSSGAALSFVAAIAAAHKQKASLSSQIKSLDKKLTAIDTKLRGLGDQITSVARLEFLAEACA